MTLLRIAGHEFEEAIAEIEHRTGSKVSTLRYRADGRLLADLFIDDHKNQTVEIVEAACASVA